jgi:hypothetical protein
MSILGFRINSCLDFYGMQFFIPNFLQKPGRESDVPKMAFLDVLIRDFLSGKGINVILGIYTELRILY